MNWARMIGITCDPPLATLIGGDDEEKEKVVAHVQ